jgi:hypothetical protein
VLDSPIQRTSRTIEDIAGEFFLEKLLEEGTGVAGVRSSGVRSLARQRLTRPVVLVVVIVLASKCHRSNKTLTIEPRLLIRFSNAPGTHGFVSGHTKAWYEPDAVGSTGGSRVLGEAAVKPPAQAELRPTAPGQFIQGKTWVKAGDRRRQTGRTLL